MASLIGDLYPRNPSAEGSGNARSAWMTWAVQELESGHNFGSFFTSPGVIIDQETRKGIATAMREFSENVGFWVAWHSTGGFDRLEDHGWSRATIYRKIKRFRESFGEHPDDYQFDWLTIDRNNAWDAAIAHVFPSAEDDQEEWES